MNSQHAGRSIVIAVFGLIVGLICLLVGDLPVALSLGATALVLSTGLAMAGAKARLRTMWTPITVFFIGAMLHGLFGYFTADYTSYSMIWMSGQASTLYDTALLIIALFVICASIGYVVTIHFPMNAAKKWCLNLEVKEEKLFWAGKTLLLAGTFLM